MYLEEIKMSTNPSRKLQDLIKFLEDGEMDIKEFLWMVRGDDNDVNYLTEQEATAFGITENRKDYGMKGMDFVVVNDIEEGVIEESWPIVSKDSGTLALYADPKDYPFEKLNALVSSILPYSEVGMVVDVSKNGYTGMLVRRTS
jgi:hypothetical protein